LLLRKAIPSRSDVGLSIGVPVATPAEVNLRIRSVEPDPVLSDMTQKSVPSVATPLGISLFVMVKAATNSGRSGTPDGAAVVVAVGMSKPAVESGKLRSPPGAAVTGNVGMLNPRVVKSVLGKSGIEVVAFVVTVTWGMLKVEVTLGRTVPAG